MKAAVMRQWPSNVSSVCTPAIWMRKTGVQYVEVVECVCMYVCMPVFVCFFMCMFDCMCDCICEG